LQPYRSENYWVMKIPRPKAASNDQGVGQLGFNQKAEADGEDKKEVNEESIIYRWHERCGRLRYDSAPCSATTILQCSRSVYVP